MQNLITFTIFLAVALALSIITIIYLRSIALGLSVFLFLFCGFALVNEIVKDSAATKEAIAEKSHSCPLIVDELQTATKPMTRRRLYELVEMCEQNKILQEQKTGT